MGRNHLIYLHLEKLLGSNEQLVIDDDHSLEYNIKTMTICRCSNNIRIIFENNEELKKYVKGIIEYFNSADLTYVNKDEILPVNREN